MDKLRSVNTKIWSDNWFEELPPTNKLLFIYLITNEKNNMLGIYEISIRKISFETSIDKGTIEKAFKEFERLKKVYYVDGYIILSNFIKHQSYNTNMKKSAIVTYNALPDVVKFEGVQHIEDKDTTKGFISLCKAFGIVRKVEREIESEVEEEIPIEKSEWDILFDKWFDYKIARRETYKNDDSIQMFKKKLHKMSNDNIIFAKEIVEQSMANNWAGIFELKNNPQITQPTKTKKIRFKKPYSDKPNLIHTETEERFNQMYKHTDPNDIIIIDNGN